ncbi:MAG TPA: hypothetical protein PK629_07440 [Oscillospiraceae bacterium]|nr:hypothetical protein [Oscillospiraceae bacterium]HPF56037.1 hypothetical protein [Clostridiales bacterium]HPK35034.1 hypothetical protein [Oscillospiraceae bacterium]HPR76283.1 hypothetical protein [Oscillospiraceae bacterium]
MRNSIKITVSLLVCFLVFLTGCGATPSTSLPDELRAANADFPESINIIAPDFFEATGAINTDQIRQKWLDETSERYGIILHIYPNYKAYIDDTGYVAVPKSPSYVDGYVSLEFESEESTPAPQPKKPNYVGLTQIGSADALKKSVTDSDPYMPLEDYLDDNPIWKALPEDFKSLYEINGHIYAIPTSVTLIQKARIIHNEALEKTGIAVTDLNSFREFALAYIQNAKKVTDNAAISEVADVLTAFGLYPGEDAYVQFNYDPTADCFTDWLTKPAAVDALEYLRELTNAGALTYRYATGSDFFKMGLWASKYAPYFDYSDCTEVLTLNPEYPQVAFTEIKGFAMIKDTPQPQETINFFIDLLFGSEQNYLDCWLGSSNGFAQNGDGTITVAMTQDLDDNFVVPAMPNLTGGLSEIFPYSYTDIIYSQNGTVATTSEIEDHKVQVKLLNDSLQDGSVVKLPPEYQIIQSATYNGYTANGSNKYNDLSSLYIKCFLSAVSRSDKTVQQIVDEYKSKMLDLGGNAMLDEMNAAIGKQTAYYYG